MATLGSLEDRLSGDILNRSDLTAESRRAIRAAIRFYERERYWSNETRTSVAASAGQTFINFPANLLIFDDIQITVQSSDYRLSRVDPETLRTWNASRTRGEPTHYAIYQNRVELFPIPDSAYSMPIFYVQQFSEVSATSDTNDMLSGAEELIVHHAAKLMWGEVIRNTDEAAKHAQLEAAALSELRKHRDQRVLHAIRATQF